MSRATPELFDLSGQDALVTGGTGWLGRALCVGLAEAGARVIVTSRDYARAAQLAKQLPAGENGEHAAVELDHLDESSIQRAVEQAQERTSRLSVLVNNGLASVGEDLHTIDLETFAEHQRNNAGYFELARAVRDLAVQRQHAASIIMVGSMYGIVGSYPRSYADIGPANSVAYQTLKAGTHQMTRHLAVYWAEDRIRVNCLAPGPFPNPAKTPPELVARLNEESPLKRMGHPDELKGAVVFLASDASSYMTGQILQVDGGWTAW